MEEELFSISFDKENLRTLQRTFLLAKVLFILSIIISVISFGYLLLLFHFQKESPANVLFRIAMYSSWTYIFLFAVFFPTQVYFYYSFVKQCHKAVFYQNAETFNASFSLLQKNAAISIISFVLNLIYVCINVYLEIQFYS